MTDAHLHNAARALREILDRKHPEWVHRVEVLDKPTATDTAKKEDA